MLIIKVKDGENIERALKRYKNKHRKVQITKELRARKNYVKPTTHRRHKLTNKILNDIIDHKMTYEASFHKQSLAAEAAFARGQIAEQAVNWPAAYTHYAHAADLDPKVQHLAHADMFAKRMGDYRKALCYGEACLNAIAETDGKTHLKYAAALNNQAVNFETTGRYDEAEPLYRQAIKIGKKTIGEDHPDYATWLNNLAGLLQVTGRYDEAEPLYKEAVRISETALGAEHPQTVMAKENYEIFKAERK